MTDLLIRASLNDHLVVNDLLAPGAGPRLSRRPLFDQLVADAHVADARPVLSDLARGAGIPYLVDPDTTFLQTEVDPVDRWAQLPFASAAALRPGEINTDQLVASVVEFQLDKGATVIIPPYFYASSPTDPWFLLGLSMLDLTAEFLRRQGVRLPMQPILCAQLQSFGTTPAWAPGVDRFRRRATDLNISSVALCLSPSGAGDDGYGKVMRLFETALALKANDLRVVAWRQGVYGPALVAAGLDGYECGLGTGEQTDIVGRQSNRKPRVNDRKRGGGGGAGIYIDTLGRSVPRRVGQVLLGDVAMRPKVICDNEGCCPTVAATLDHGRHHAVRTRSRNLAELREQPHRSWRLTHVSRQAAQAATVAAQANKVLAAQGVKIQIKARGLISLAAVASHLADRERDTRTG
jgi:hypothetical protein